MNSGNRDDLEATLVNHRAFTFNRFKELHGPHVIAITSKQYRTCVFPIRSVRAGITSAPRQAICGAAHTIVECVPVIAEWPNCPDCARLIYEGVKTGLPELTSLESEVSGDTGQLSLPGAENWGR